MHVRRSLTRWGAPLALLLALASAPARATEDDAPIGTFQLSGKEGARSLSGRVTIRPAGASAEGGLTLEGPLGSRGAVALQGARDGAGWTFTPPVAAETGGIAGALLLGAEAAAPAAPAYTLRLAPGKAAGRFTGEVVDADGRPRMKLDLVRRKRALIAHAVGYGASHDNTFLVYGRQIRTYYRALGHEVDMVPAERWDAVLDPLRAAREVGAPYTRVALIGHGGWDGPIFGGQISPWWGQARWGELIAALRAGTAPEARVLVSACHAAGSDRYERARGDVRGFRSWVDEVGRAAGRVVAGPAGITSTTLALRQARALEGAGTVAQETRVASGEGVRVTRGSVAAAKLIPWDQVDAEKAAALAALAAAEAP